MNERSSGHTADDSYSLLVEALCERLRHDPSALAQAMQAVHDCAGMLIYIHKPSRRARQLIAARSVAHLPRPVAVSQLQTRLKVCRTAAYQLLQKVHADA